ncbi:MAG: hypothetical protein AAGA18_08280 [Verrucomicrobiota bacterium]
MLTWRNASNEILWIPYVGHRNEADFKTFAADPWIMLQDDLNNFRKNQ